MKISIVTPTYNSGKYLLSTLDSIHNQSYKELENIVYDGQSNDETLEILQSYKAPLDWVSEDDNGQSDAINKGFEKVTGDIVAWQNADDLYEPDTFQYISEYFKDNPNVGLIYGGYKEIDEDGKHICTVHTKPWNVSNFKRGRFCPVQPTVFWRKSVLDKVGKLNLDLHYCMDVDFYSRTFKEGFIIKGIDKVLGSFRVHNESKTQNKSNRLRHKREYLHVLSNHFTYNFIDRLIFEFYYLRSQLAVKVKRMFKI